MAPLASYTMVFVAYICHQLVNKKNVFHFSFFRVILSDERLIL